MRINRRPGRAFTLVEVVVVIAVIVVVGLVIFTNLLGGKSQADLNSATTQIVASTRQAQSEAAAQSGNAVWGIHFANTTNTAPYYAIFTGSSYASGTVQGRYPLPPTVGYVTSTLPAGSSEDVIFSGITGAPTATTSIGLYLISNPADTQYVAVNGVGQVSYSSSAPITCNGTVGPWGATASLNTPIDADAASGLAYNGYVYLIGGEDNNNNETSTVVYSTINPNGTLGGWSATTHLPNKDYMAASVASNGYAYLMGGYSPGASTATVLYSQISSNGTLGSWNVTQALPLDTYNQSAATYNGYIYSMGGYSHSTSKATSTVNYAEINSNGTITSWTATQSLPNNLTEFGAVAYDGYLYAIGGLTSNGVFTTSTIYYAQINSNGTLGAWASTTPGPRSDMSGPAVAYGGYMYIVGGGDSIGDSTANVISAKINSNGTLGGWSQTTALPNAMTFMPSVAYNGYFYLVGGDPSNYTATATVLYASLCVN